MVWSIVLAGCGSGLEANQDNLGDIATEVDALRKEVADLRAEKDLLGVELSGLQATLASERVRNQEQEETISDLNKTIGTLSSSIEGLADDVESLETWKSQVQAQPLATQSWVSSQSYATTSAVSAVDAKVVALQATTSALEGDVASLVGLEPLLDYVSVDPDADAIFFVGANVYIQSGSGTTTGTATGTGNLILGYDEDSGDEKSGSHTLVIGPYHTYTATAGVVFGSDNLSDSATPYAF